MTPDLDKFLFRDLHPQIKIGTASDRYAGWIGQIYSENNYKISSRMKSLGGKSFKEEILPVESVKEYFEHFSVLEIDFTFYRPLLDKDLKPTPNFQVLNTYKRYLGKNDRLILKVPQAVFAQRLRKGGKFVENPDYLNAEMFSRQFYEPADKILGDLSGGFIFEQEYRPKKDRQPPKKYAESLDEFFSNLPKDRRYHIETRTESYHISAYFDVLTRHGIGHVLSHWTWLPSLRKQFLKSGKQFYNSGRQCVIRLMTPLRMRYDESYAQAFPFNKMVEGMMNREMITDTVEIIRNSVKDGVQVNVIINNRVGGNAPLIARELVTSYFKTPSQAQSLRWIKEANPRNS